MNEEWKPVKGYEGLYEVSNWGRIRSLPRLRVKGRLKSQNMSKWGYLLCQLWKNGKVKSFSIHRLVAEAFIPNPENKETVNHIDCNKLNNKADNLEWTTQNENVHHSLRLGHYEKSKYKKPVLMFDMNGCLVGKFDGVTDAAKATGLYTQNISKCCHGELKSTGGFKWQFQ